MQHQWTRQQSWIQHPDGQRRWNRAYQLLGEWTKVELPPFIHPIGPLREEKAGESGHLSSCVDTEASRDTHD